MKISVTLPNYNHARYLAQNIEAVLGQSYGDWELIVVDDGSTDDSWSIIESFSKRDPRILAVRLAQNQGPNVAMKRCLSLASGELLYASSSDDHIGSTSFFRYVIDELAKHPGVGGVCGRCRVVDSADDSELWVMGTAGGTYGYISAPRVVERFWTGRLFVPGNGAVWRRALLEQVGGYDPALGPQSDYFVNHAIPALHGLVFLEDVVGVTRLVRGGYSSSVGDEEFFRYHALFEKRMKSLPLPIPVQEDWLRTWRYNVANGRLAISRQEQFFELARSVFEEIENWELNALPPKFEECKDYVLNVRQQLESELLTRRTNAARILDEIAGPLPSEVPLAPPPQKASDASRLLKFLRRVKRKLRGLLGV